MMTDQTFEKIVTIDPQVFEDHWRVNVGNLIFSSSAAIQTRPITLEAYQY